MSQVHIAVHDCPRDLYDKLALEEHTGDTATWKRIETKSCSLTIFRRDALDAAIKEWAAFE